jgi:four helix bundle protein
MGKFQDLKVWQKAKDLAVDLYRLTGEGAFGKDWGFRDQVRRAVISIPSNIAQGGDSITDRQAIKFFYAARGSSAEVLNQAIIAQEIGYVTQEQFDHITEACGGISAMLTKLIQARGKKDGPAEKPPGTQEPNNGKMKLPAASCGVS